MYFELANILLFVVIAFLTVFVLLVVTKLARPHEPTTEKNKTYECGEPPASPA